MEGGGRGNNDEIKCCLQQPCLGGFAPLTRHNQLQLARLTHTNYSIDVNVELPINIDIFTTILKNIFSEKLQRYGCIGLHCLGYINEKYVCF